MAKIKVGLIRVDTHSYYYGTLMQRPDPVLLQKHNPATHYYMYGSFSGRYGPDRIIVPTVRSFEIVKVWDADRDEAERFSETFGGTAKVCRSYADASSGVDLLFVANCDEPHSGADHLELATPGLKRGVPTFIDKPLAYTVSDARKLLALAAKHKTPLLSISILRASPHVAMFRKRLQEIAPVEFITVKGNGYAMAGQIHLISLAQHLVGVGAESVAAIPGLDTTYCKGEPAIGHIHIGYGGGIGKPAAGVVLNCASGDTWHCSIYVNAYSGKGALSTRVGDFEFPYGAAAIVRMARRMVKTGRSPLRQGEMLENIAVAEAARVAQKHGKRVQLRDV